MAIVHRKWGNSFLSSIFLFSEVNGSFLAAGLSYFALFSMFPLLLVLVGVAAHVLDQSEAMRHVAQFLHQAMPAQEKQVMTILQAVLDNRGSATLMGVLVLWWAAKGAFGASTTALNLVWNAPYPRSYLIESLRSLLLAATAGAAILSSGLLLTTLSAALHWEIPSLGWSPKHLHWLATLANQLVPSLGAMGSFAFLYRFLPAIKTTWREQWPGAVAAALLWELLRRGFGWYLSNYGNYDLVYGPLAGMIGFMFWVYLTGIVFLWGACWNRCLHQNRGPKS